MATEYEILHRLVVEIGVSYTAKCYWVGIQIFYAESYEISFRVDDMSSYIPGSCFCKF